MKQLSPVDATRYLWEVASDHLDPDWESVVKYVLEDIRFKECFGSSPGKHHAYPGGLLVHTAEVMYMGLKMFCPTAFKDPTFLILATMYHDFAKIYDYDLETGAKLPYRDIIRHVAGSYAEWVLACRKFDVIKEFEDRVGHCILAHHGRYEWNSPVLPQTEEAYILHAADQWSAAYGLG